MRLDSRRGRAWDEQAIRAALTEFLRGWEVWPTCEEFAVAGAKGLREAITHIRGAEWWAKEMGLPGGARRPGGVRRWTNEAIRATLTEFFGERSTWPTHREFNEAGLRGLREALRYYGGPERWSIEMGVSWTPPATRARRQSQREKPNRPVSRSREWPKWNERTIAAELKTFLAGRDEWPRHAEFVETGRQGLYHAILKHGGSRAWALRIGVRWVTRYAGSPAYWTEERVRERLAEFLGRRVVWPPAADFAAAEQGPLLKAVRRLGGIERWAREFGLPYLPAISRGVGTRRTTLWKDAQIEAAISPLIEQLGRWPTKGEFRRAGLSKALAAAYTHGGSTAWQQRFGVEPRPFDGPVPERRRWNAELVEATLSDFCRARTSWPTFAEFRAAGEDGLYQAAVRYGGIHHWQERLALAPRSQRRVADKVRT